MKTVVISAAEAASELANTRSQVRKPSPWKDGGQFTVTAGCYVRYEDETDATKTKKVLGFELHPVSNPTVTHELTVSTFAAPRYDADGLEVTVTENNFGDLVAAALNNAALKTDADVVAYVLSQVQGKVLTCHRKVSCVNYSGRNMKAVAFSY